MSHRLRLFLESHELSLKGVAVALFAHEFLGLGWLGISWLGCYYVQPSNLAVSLLNYKNVEVYMDKAKR